MAPKRVRWGPELKGKTQGSKFSNPASKAQGTLACAVGQYGAFGDAPKIADAWSRSSS